MEKVIFDTNIVDNSEAHIFFGNRNDLKRFKKYSELIFPDVVIEEIKNHIRRKLDKNKSTFLENPFHWIKNLSKEETEQFDIESHINELISEESFIFEVIELTDYSCLSEMKELALRNLPPFEENTDKGFKDTFIYFTILEYLQKIEDDYVYFVTDDRRLKKSFTDNPNVIVIENFDEYMDASLIKQFDDYFIEKLKAEIDNRITRGSIIDYWMSINDNKVLLLEIEDENYLVEIDSQEIVAFKKIERFMETIKALILSNNYSDTLGAIRLLTHYTNYISIDNAIDILRALVENLQVSGTVGAGDYTIDFMGDLYSKVHQFLPEEINSKIPERIVLWGLL